MVRPEAEDGEIRGVYAPHLEMDERPKQFMHRQARAGSPKEKLVETQKGNPVGNKKTVRETPKGVPSGEA